MAAGREMNQVFSVHVTVRGYETDRLGHLNQAVYSSWAEHSRVELLRSAGVPLPSPRGLAIVVLEAHIRFLRELRVGDEVDVTCAMAFGDGKTFSMDSTFLRADGTVCAEVRATMGLMDLGTRRLVAEPEAKLSALAHDPDGWAQAALLGERDDAGRPE